LLLIHFMAVPLVAAIGIHLILVEYRSLWRFKWSIAGIVVVMLGISWPYWSYLFHNYAHNIPGGTSRWLGWFYPLLGAHHLSAAGLTNILGETWRSPAPRILLVAQWITALAYPAAWAGMLLAIPSVYRVLCRSERVSAADQLYSVAWVAVILQCILYGPLHVHEGPHYFNAAWIYFAVFVFLAARRPWRFRFTAMAECAATITEPPYPIKSPPCGKFSDTRKTALGRSTSPSGPSIPEHQPCLKCYSNRQQQYRACMAGYGFTSEMHFPAMPGSK
jgi:hypothetical protein